MPSRVLVALRVKAAPERAFEAFTGEIGQWWRPNGLFHFHPRGTGELTFEPGEGGRLTERLSTGGIFEIGRVKLWDPPTRVVFSWRQVSFAPDQDTEVHVTFELVGDETRVTVEHLGWDAIPSDHVARHHFPDFVFLQRHGEWWNDLLGSFRAHVQD